MTKKRQIKKYIREYLHKYCFAENCCDIKKKKANRLFTSSV